ncbi:MAG: glycosyltransferase [Candidatus Sumerlaeia bacterium]
MRTAPRPSILHVYKDYYPPVLGGIEKCIHWMADATSDEYHVTVLVASRDRQLHDDIIDGVRVVRVGCLARAFSSPLSPGYVKWLRRLRSDILHFHMPNPVGELAALLANQPCRMVATYHSDIVRQKLTGLIYRPLQRRFLDRLNLIMPTSQRYIDSSATLQPFAQKCKVVPLGVPVSEYESTDTSRAFAARLRDESPDRTRIIFLGVLRYYKGLHFLVEAMEQLPAKAVLLIGGDGPERARLESLVHKKNLTDRVRFLGAISDDEAVGLREAGDIFCLPAHLRSEAFGLCQIEAMLAALPLVSTNLDTGVPEINQHETTGLIVPPANSAALAQALTRLVEDDCLRRKLGTQARERALENYTAATMGKRLKKIYASLVKSPA